MPPLQKQHMVGALLNSATGAAGVADILSKERDKTMQDRLDELQRPPSDAFAMAATAAGAYYGSELASGSGTAPRIAATIVGAILGNYAYQALIDDVETAVADAPKDAGKAAVQGGKVVFHEANRLLDDATHGKMSEGDWGEVGIGTAVFGPTVVAAGKGLATVGRGIWSVGSAAVSRASAFNAEVGAAAEAEGAAPIVAEGAEGALVVSETALAPLAVA